MDEVIGLITARGGSKAVPRKNIKQLAGKPLIAWTIEAALQSQSLSRVIVSTEDEEIASVARAWGAETPFIRPLELAQDESSSISVVEHAIRWLEQHAATRPGYVMLLQPTSPLRTAQDIDGAVDLARARGAVAVVSVCEMAQHPYVSKRLLADGTVADLICDDSPYRRRQDLPPAYAVNGAIYLNRIESLLRDRAFLPHGTYAYRMPTERSLDIDHPWDFYLADLVLRDRNEGKAY